MADYNVKHTDTTKTPILVTQDSQLDAGTDLTLFGRSFLEYGEQLNENLLHLLENFACPQVLVGGLPVPDQTQTTGGNLLSEPVPGQIWYNTTAETIFYWNGTIWIQMSAGSDYAANKGQVSDGQSLPRPISSSGYVFPYSECIWLVSPAGHAGRFDYMACTTDNNAVVTMKYRLLGNATLTSGQANYLIVGIRGNVSQGNHNEQLPGITPTPTPTQGASATPQPTPTPVVTQTPVVSPTATTTPTPSPTRASSPTPTPVPSVTPSPRPALAITVVDSARGGNFASSLSLCEIADHAITRDFGNQGCSTTVGICGVNQCAPEPGTYGGGGNDIGPEIGITASGGVAPYTVRFRDFTMTSGQAQFAASGDCLFIGGSSGFSTFPSGVVYAVVINANGGSVSGISINASCGSGVYTAGGTFTVEVTDAIGAVQTRTFPYTVQRTDLIAQANFSFENGFTNWINNGVGGTAFGLVTVTSGYGKTVYPAHGTRHIHAANRFPGIKNCLLPNAVLFPVTPGQTKTATAKVCTFNLTNQGYGAVVIQWINSSGGVISNTEGSGVYGVNPSNSWRTTTASGVAPAGATHCRVALRSYQQYASNVIDELTLFDNVTLVG